MLTRDNLFDKYPDITEGSVVYGKDGEKLGKITSLFDNYFNIQKGIFFPRDFSVRYDDIADVREGDIYLSLGKDELAPWTDESYAGWSHIEEINAGRLKPEPKEEYKEAYKDRYGGWVTEKTEVPLMEEKVEAQKHTRQVGEVALHKIVHTELRHFTVPVMKEEVRVERAAVSERDVGAGDTTAFQESTTKVPVMEEEVTISKRPVVKEEVRVTKERHTEEKSFDTEVKREDIEIKEEGDLGKKKAG